MDIKAFEKQVDKVLKESDEFSMFSTQDFQCD